MTAARLFQRGYCLGMNYREINNTAPGEIIQMWLFKVGE